MSSLDFHNRSVLVTGGTRGLGKAIGLEFARAGATVFLTHRWGSVDERELAGEFQAEGLPAPVIIECDVSDGQANRNLMKTVKTQVGFLDVVVSNVAFSKVAYELGDLKKSVLDLSLGYSAWPVVDLVQATSEIIERLPRYIIGISSDGAEVCHTGYDLAGASKAVLETLCRYLAVRLKPHGVRVNAIRPGFLDTASSRATFGDGLIEQIQDDIGELFLDPYGVAQVCLALCSGLMDAVTGQVITVDEGWSLVSPLAYLTGHGIPGTVAKSTGDDL